MLIYLDKPDLSVVSRNLWLLRVMHSLPLLVLRQLPGAGLQAIAEKRQQARP